jgi:hypothetical protein
MIPLLVLMLLSGSSYSLADDLGTDSGNAIGTDVGLDQEMDLEGWRLSLTVFF